MTLHDNKWSKAPQKGVKPQRTFVGSQQTFQKTVLLQDNTLIAFGQEAQVPPANTACMQIVLHCCAKTQPTGVQAAEPCNRREVTRFKQIQALTAASCLRLSQLQLASLLAVWNQRHGLLQSTASQQRLPAQTPDMCISSSDVIDLPVCAHTLPSKNPAEPVSKG